MFPHLLRKESAFTLVETLIAATIVATAIVAIAHLAAIGIRQSAASGRTLAALLAAQGKLEQIAGGPIAVGAGEETGEWFLRWSVTPVAAVDPTVVSLNVCASESAHAGQPPICVATLRATRP